MGITGDLRSAFLQALFQQLTALVLEELKLLIGFEEELRKLIITHSTIAAYLNDAEDRQQTDHAVTSWLNQLRDIAYDTNDLLDEVATEGQRRQLIQFPKVRDSLSFANPMRTHFRVQMSHRIKKITERLDGIGKLRTTLGLRERPQAESSEQLSETTSLNFLSFLPIGRDNDKRKIVNLLVSSNGVAENGVTVIPVLTVLGMGGIGKTTLAQLVYNDERVGNYFELCLWIHVSRDFNVNKITKDIIKAIDSSAVDAISRELALDGLQKHLRMRINGKKYLIVLDDVWNENPLEWGKLRAPLLCGASGSKILVTTRNQDVANIMGTMPPYRLQGLSDDDCWSLICQHTSDSNLSDLDTTGYKIVKMCKGLPLAAEVVGFRLRREDDRSTWETILQDEMWEFFGKDNDIKRSIRWSYQDLPAHLKVCFAYSSIFPKDYAFDKEQLVKLWMAQNFLQSAGEELMEAVGGRYFDYLVGRSFFQFSPSDCKYTMHSVIHEFAQHVSGVDCCIVEDGKQRTVSTETRHLSLILQQRSTSDREVDVFQGIYGCKGLYTLLVIHDSVHGLRLRIPKDLAEKLICLRSLDLSNCGISQMPVNIGDLKHLRYLQLRNNNIESLPRSVGCLYNLQTLGLANCYALKDLPEGTSNLRRLRHLDLHLDYDYRSSILTSMAPDIGKLIHLRTLSRFVVSREKGCGLSELQSLNNLHGELCISNLHHVLNIQDAVDANLNGKTYLRRLELWWSTYSGTSSSNWQAEEKVLTMLRPHTNIKEIKVVGYGGALFPSWIRDPVFCNLTTLVLWDCTNCKTLPSLGQLPKLENLYIKGLDSVVLVDCALCGQKGNIFPALRKLHFEDMCKLQVWCGDENCELRSLRELVFKNCGDLRQLTHRLPTLEKLVIEGSHWFIGLPRFPSLHSLAVKASGGWIWESCSSLTSLSSLTISQLSSITLPPGRQGPASLRRLEISHCNQLIYLPDDWLPSGLNYFAIRHCSQLRALPKGLKDLETLEDMEIEDCPLLQNLPDDLPKALQFLSIDNCPELSQRYIGQERVKLAGISSVWIDKEPGF